MAAREPETRRPSLLTRLALAALLPATQGQRSQAVRALLFRSGVEGHDIVVLRHAVAGRPRAEWGDVRVLRAPSPEVQLWSEALGAPLDEARAAQRFGRGLVYVALLDGGCPVASSWAVVGAERFVDEIGVSYRAADSELWVRDVRVMPARRGQGLFARAMDALLALHPGVRTMLSDVRVENQPSLSAHARYGFAAIGRLSAVHVRSSWMLRDVSRCPLAPAFEFRPGRSLLRTGPEYAAVVGQRLA